MTTELDREKRLRKKAMSLPLRPGVYLMKDKSGTIIYVGKAKALKNRVSSYFGSHTNHTTKVIRMVEHVQDFDYIVTDSEFEALVLECSLIKQHSPKYNILLKDDKGYHYVKITKGSWPRIDAAMQLVDDGSEYIGPYTGSFAVRQTVDEVKKIFRLPQCTKTFPVTHRQRPCLNFHISQCSAPCAGKISQADYKRSVEQAVEFLKGGSAETVKRMQAEMEQAAENLDFEKAAVLRDRINAITKFGEKQKVVSADVAEQDVFALAQSQDKACLAVLRFFAGRLCDTEHFIIDAPEDDAVARYELIMGYYSMRERIPPRILIDSLPQDAELISQWLSEKLGKKVSFVVPQRGGQLKLLEMCRSNASEKLALSLGRKGKDTAALDELARLLGLDSPPEYIESYDISHTAGTENVAGMVVFKNGQPYKQAYKRFKIKGFEGQDDCASMAEVLERRFTHYFEENAKPEGEKRDEGFAKLPDLILLDGAEMQVNAVRAVFLRMGIDVPLYGMVKDSSHRTRAITGEGGEISINSKRSAFTLVSRIQEEVHRFAIEYHRKRRSAGISTTLTQIEGVGQKRAAALLKHFKSVNAVKEASFDELCSVKGVDKRSAQTVFDYFHSDKG
ncbi:MAG: excinuclease ABC subunit UvrC [Acutalibacteraceae bacterium]|nr:excinuclease ABC subunit UvrC [Acutalibacteraceae bacterium]